MKRVLVPLAIDPHEDGVLGQRHYIRNTYVLGLLRAGLLPVFVSHLTPKEGLQEIYEECDGVLIPGGRDVNPAYYAGAPHQKSEFSALEFDKWEGSLIQTTIADKKPLFAICRGMQLLNVVLGGTLHQHIGDLRIKTNHGGEGGGLPYQRLADCLHPVHIDKASRFYMQYGQETIYVSSGHHQAVCDIASDLHASGRCPDGIIEVLEHKDPEVFLIALQSHPEMMEGSFAASLFESFKQAIEGYSSIG
jgi:putative glutamine amidotransferase